MKTAASGSAPGELVALDSFYIGNLKGVGRVLSPRTPARKV